MDVLATPWSARLFQIFDSALNGSHAMWVAGLPSAGKSTVVECYLRERKRTAALLLVDDRCDDPAAFFEFINAELRTLRCNSSCLLQLRPDYLKAIPTLTRNFFDAVEAAAVEGDVTVVLDDYERLSASSPLHTGLAEVASCLRREVRLVFISCSAPPADNAAFERALKNGKLRLVQPEQLNLTLTEAMWFAERRIGEALTTSFGVLLTEMHAASGGVIGAFLESLELLANDIAQLGEHLDPRTLCASSYRSSFDARFSRYFDSLDEIEQRLVLGLGVLAETTQAIACELEGEAAGDILERLSRNSLYIRRVRRATYRFHELFKDFLKSRLTDEAYARHCIRVATILEAHNRLEDAAGLYHLAREWKPMALLIERLAEGFAETGRLQTLATWILAVPAEILDTVPILTYWYGICRMPFDGEESYQLFSQSFRQFAPSDDAKRTRACVAAIESIVLMWRDFVKLDDWILYLDQLATSSLESLPIDIQRRCAASMLCALILRNPEESAVDKWLDFLRRISSSNAIIHHHSSSLMGLAVALTLSRMLGHSERVATLMAALSRTSGGGSTDPKRYPLAAIAHHYVWSGCNLADGDIPAALNHISEGLSPLPRNCGGVFPQAARASGV